MTSVANLCELHAVIDVGKGSNPLSGSARFQKNLFFTERTLTGHLSLKLDDDRHKPTSGYSAMAVAKSAFSPMCCLISLSHA